MFPHSKLDRSIRRSFSPPGFYEWRNRILNVHEIPGAPFSLAVCRKGGCFKSVRHRYWKSDGLARHRHSEKIQRRAISRVVRSSSGTRQKAWNHLCACHAESHGPSRRGMGGVGTNLGSGSLAVRNRCWALVEPNGKAKQRWKWVLSINQVDDLYPASQLSIGSVSRDRTTDLPS